MKKQIVHIANQLKLGEITTKEAKEELLVLFGVSGSLYCEHCEPNEIDVTRCPNCGSTDHRIDKPYKCHDCGTVW